MPHARFRALRLLTAGSLIVTLAACTRGCVGADEIAFCDAVARNDAAAAKALFDSGRLNMLARNTTGSCQPLASVFDAARPQSPEFTAMAVALAKREGIANTYWTVPSGSSGRGSSGGGEGRPIKSAARNANPVVMRALIDAGVNVTNNAARNALIDIVASGSLELLRMLVDAGADPNAALGSAIAWRHLDMIAYLEGKGARERADDVLVAARKGDLATIDAAIARRANLDVKDGGDRTPLMRAAMYGHPAVVTKLAQAGAQLEATSDGETALHMAARENHAPVVRALAAARANLNARADANSPTPLIVAVRQGAVQALAALIDAGADANVAIESDTTVIGRAIELGNLALVRELLRGGARVNDKGGPGWQPPIHEMVGICGLAPEGTGDNDYYRVTLLKTLVAAGADTKARNAEGRTPVEVLTKLLMQADTSANAPFYRACRQAKLDYLRSVR
jgi:ankyrin repeat protein